MMVGRGAKSKGTRYFGPYSHAWAIRETVDLLLRVFPMRSCSNGVFKRSGQIGRPVPARLHRQVLGAVRRPRRPPRSTARSSTTSATSWPARPTRSSGASSSEMYAASDGAGLREGRPAARRPRRAEQGAGEAGGGARRRHRRRRDRAGRGPARGRRPDLLRPRRPDPRPARLGRRPGRGGRHRRAGRGLPAPALRRRGRATRSRARSWCPALPDGRRDVRGAARRAAGQQGRRSGCRSAATRRRSRRPSPATPRSRWRCTRPSGPAT